MKRLPLIRRSCAIRGDGSPSIEIQAEFFPVETTNARWSVAYLTLSIDGTPDDERREAIDKIVRNQGGKTIWREHPAVGRSYALLELPDGYDAEAIRSASGGVAYETAVIAVAVSPAVPQALPSLLEALSGPGRPAGILACRGLRGGVILEWDPTVSSVELVLGLVDVELRRFASGRTTELLSPLPPASVAKIAAQGLQAPQIAPDRVLELLIDDA
ncbi:MAG TPA: hypothetical protein VFE35_05995 [Candidatus Cybelea sp.]|jgi:hypothetical protein|nr:hypothetical protein [Candidatus Cybelea sp.]